MSDEKNGRGGPAEFSPTPAQVGARARVRELVDLGNRTPVEWLNVMREDEAKSKKPPLMSSDQWREWKRVEGFEEWFYEDLFPKPSVYEMQAMQPDYLEGVAKALRSGDPAVLKWYQNDVLAKMDTNDVAIGEIIMNRDKWKKKPSVDEDGS